MIRALALVVAVAPALAQAAPEAHVERVVEVFLAMGCEIDPLRDGAKAEQAAGLGTFEFSEAVAVLEARGEATMDPATFQFRLNHKDCP
jgi:hypothetical protein